MESFSSASYSKWDDDRAWSSQEWKTDLETYERSGRPDETSWRARHEKFDLVSLTRKLFTTEPRNPLRTRKYLVTERCDQFIIENDETELELSVESRSFVNRVNDHVRKKDRKEFQMMEKTFHD